MKVVHRFHAPHTNDTLPDKESSNPREPRLELPVPSR
jgi:hypothetical protein